MNKLARYLIIVTSAMILLFASGCSGWDPNKPGAETSEADATIARFKKMDSSLQAFFDQAYAYVVFPNVGKGAVVIGGAYGKGKVYRQHQIVGSATLTQVTIGAQLGGQGYSELIFFQDQAAFDRFKEDKMEFDAQVSAVAIKYGAAAQADYHSGVAVFVMPKAGLMFEASVGGQVFSYEPNK